MRERERENNVVEKKIKEVETKKMDLGWVKRYLQKFHHHIYKYATQNK
jgi:hypothetical protein